MIIDLSAQLVRNIALLDVKLLLRYQHVWWKSLLTLFFPIVIYAYFDHSSQGWIIPILALVLLLFHETLTTDLTRTSEEFRGYSVLGIQYNKLILAKNISSITVVLLLGVAPNVSLAAILFQLPFSSVIDVLIYLGSVIFLLLIAGNFLSILFPRVDSFSQFALLGLLYMTAVLLSSLPYFVFKVILRSNSSCFIIAALSFITWYFVAIPKSAELLKRRKYTLLAPS